MTKTVKGSGRYPAVRAKDLKEGQVIIRPYKGKARVTKVTLGLKTVWLNLAGVEHEWSINIHKRPGSWVAVEA